MDSVFDELNQLSQLDELKRKSVDYEEYFGEMDLTDKEKEERISLAEKFEIIFLFLFLLMSEGKTKKYENMVYEKYVSVSLVFLKQKKVPLYIDEYAKDMAKEIVDTTQAHINDKYYLSKDRAMFIAENEANVVGNYRQQIEAIKSGMKYKTWITKNDKKVRHTHKDVNNKKISIFDVFQVGNSEMMFPKDSNGETKEIVNCRCVLHYS